MTLIERFYRWKASRGYGVHSPLAFRLIKNVVRPERGVIYYGEERLGETEGLYGRPLARARLLLRIVAELQPAYVWVSPGIPEYFLEAIRLAGGVVRIYEGDVFPDEIAKADLIVLCSYNLKKALLKKIMQGRKAIVGFDVKRSLEEGLEAVMKSGVILDACGNIIAVGSDEGQLHTYKISCI